MTANFRGTVAAVLLAGAALATGPAQAQSGERVRPDTTQETTQPREENHFPWGLLGLLGLAGLLGRKKQDDIHVDARHDRRNV